MKTVLEYVCAILCWVAIWCLCATVYAQDLSNISSCFILSGFACALYVFITITVRITASRLTMVSCGISGFLSSMISYFLILSLFMHWGWHGSAYCDVAGLTSDILMWIVPGLPIGMVCYGLVHRRFQTTRLLSKINSTAYDSASVAQITSLDWVVFGLSVVYTSPFVVGWSLFHGDPLALARYFFSFYLATMICSLFTFSWCSSRRNITLNRISLLLHCLFFASPFLLALAVRGWT